MLLHYDGKSKVQLCYESYNLVNHIYCVTKNETLHVIYIE